MKLFRYSLAAAAVVTTLLLSACGSATSAKDDADDTLPVVVLADFEDGIGDITVTQGYNGLSTVSGAIDSTESIVGGDRGTKALKFTYGSAATKTFGQTNILLPLSGVDYSGYSKIQFDIRLDDQAYAGWLPVLRGEAGSDATWNDAWAAKDTNNDATGSAKDTWITMSIDIPTSEADDTVGFKAVSWGTTVTQATLSDAFKNYANLDINVIENGYDNSGTNNDGNLKTGWIDNIKLIP